MSTVHGAAAARRASVRLAITDRTVLIGLGALVVLLAVLTWQSWGDLGSDTGYDLVASQRLADGEIPYRDFPYFYGPLAPAVGALFVLVGGSGLGPFIALGMILAAAIIFTAYALARVVAGPLASGLAAAITATVAFAPTNFSFVLPHTHSATIGLLAALLFLLGVSRFAADGARGWLWCAGGATAAATLARPEFALAVWLAGGLWVALRLRARTLGRRDLTALLAPAAGIPLVVYGALMAATSPYALLFENLYPVDQINAGAGEVINIAAPMTASSVAELLGRLALYALGAAALLAVAAMIERGGRARTGALVLVAVVAAGALAALAVRPELVRHGLQFAYGWIPAGAVLAVGVLLWRRHRTAGEWSPAAQAELLLATLLAVIAARTYAAFFANATVPQQAAYAIPFAAVFLAWLHDRELGVSPSARRIGAGWLAFLALAGAVLVASDAADRSARVTGPGGTLSERPGPAASYQAALDTILRETAPGDPVLLAPQLTSLYTLSGRTDPLPQISLLPGSLPDAQAEREAIRRLDESGVDLVVVNTRDLTEYGQGAFGDTYYRTIQDWLDSDFRRVASYGNDGETTVALDVWQRRTS